MNKYKKVDYDTRLFEKEKIKEKDKKIKYPVDSKSRK